MQESKFIFADLSTYDLKIARDFYSVVFQWSYNDSDPEYLIAEHRGKQISGLYETPQKFKDLKMPSFWMSYIQVGNVDDIVEKAKLLGGIIELVDKGLPVGQVALIRDPLGAGFTVYEGTLLNSRFENETNALVWNELYVSDFAKVRTFYEKLFNWSFHQDSEHRFFIKNESHKTIGGLHQVSEEFKGEKEYWSVFFGVEDTSKTKSTVLNNGGKLIFEDSYSTVLADPMNAFFHIVQVNKVSNKVSSPLTSSFKSNFKWKATIGLILIFVSFVFDWVWIWGVFFSLWVYADLRSGYTHLFEAISRKENPLLYWLILTVWASLGVYSVAYYLTV